MAGVVLLEGETTCPVCKQGLPTYAGRVMAKHREDKRFEEIATLQAKLKIATEALEYYADKSEWEKLCAGSPWKLYFESSTVDGDGYEVAQKALKQIKESE